jgi:hypothetical protein
LAADDVFEMAVRSPVTTVVRSPATASPASQPSSPYERDLGLYLGRRRGEAELLACLKCAGHSLKEAMSTEAGMALYEDLAPLQDALKLLAQAVQSGHKALRDSAVAVAEAVGVEKQHSSALSLATLSTDTASETTRKRYSRKYSKVRRGAPFERTKRFERPNQELQRCIPVGLLHLGPRVCLLDQTRL